MEDGSGELHSINSRVENNDYQQMYNLGEEHYPNYNTAGYEQSDGMEEDIYEDDLYNQAEEGTSEMLHPDNNNEYQMAEEDENKQTRVYFFTPKENVPRRYFFHEVIFLSSTVKSGKLIHFFPFSLRFCPKFLHI